MSEKIAVPGLASGISMPDDLDMPGIEQQVIDFLEGRSDGAAVMLAIYGDIADEPLPPRLAALVERWREP